MSFYIPYYGYNPQGGFGQFGVPQQQMPLGPSLVQPIQETVPTQLSAPPTQPTQQVQLTPQSQSMSPALANQLYGEQSPSFDFGNVNWLGTGQSLLGPTFNMGANLIGGSDPTYGSLAGAGLGALTNILGQAGKTPIFSEMGQQALPVLQSALGGGETSLLNSINPVGTMLSLGGTGGNLGGSIAGAAMPAIAGGLSAAGLAAPIAEGLGLGTTAAVEGLGGALGAGVEGAGAAIGTGLGALGGAAGALSFPAMALGNILYGLINELGGGDHPSMAEYQQSALMSKMQQQSSDLLGQLHGAGMTDAQIIDWATKNNINWMMGNIVDTAKPDSSGYWEPQYSGGRQGIVMLATPEMRSNLDQIATGAMYGQPTSWPMFEGSPYGWNAPANYLYYPTSYAAEDPSTGGITASIGPNLETLFGYTGLSQGAQPPMDYKLSPYMQAELDASWKDYTGAQAPTDLEKQWVTDEVTKMMYNVPTSPYSSDPILGSPNVPITQEMKNLGYTQENQGITTGTIHELYNHLLQNYSDPSVRDWMAGKNVLWESESGSTLTEGLAQKSPTVQSYYAPLVKQYTDLGYDLASAQEMAQNPGSIMDILTATAEPGSTFGPQDPYFAAPKQMIWDQNTGWQDAVLGPGGAPLTQEMINLGAKPIADPGYNFLPTIGDVFLERNPIFYGG